MEPGNARLLAAAGMLALALTACGEDTPPPVPKPKVAAPAAPAPAPSRAETKAEPAPKPAADSADSALAARVKEALLAEKALNAHGIDVGARNGVVTLFGTVQKKSELEHAARIAAGTEGARSVENKLVVLAGS
jgi:hypothetical protein